jgi:hypothetical protein
VKFELRASCFLGRCSTMWATLSALFLWTGLQFTYRECTDLMHTTQQVFLHERPCVPCCLLFSF